jgi:hypothetical protein
VLNRGALGNIIIKDNHIQSVSKIWQKKNFVI